MSPPVNLYPVAIHGDDTRGNDKMGRGRFG
jgi:hypothetical protein